MFVNDFPELTMSDHFHILNKDAHTFTNRPVDKIEIMGIRSKTKIVAFD